MMNMPIETGGGTTKLGETANRNGKDHPEQTEHQHSPAGFVFQGSLDAVEEMPLQTSNANPASIPSGDAVRRFNGGRGRTV